MFVRFRRSPTGRLHVSIVEARRADGRIRQDHVASLGSVPAPPSTWERIRFWQRVHERLARLSNRIDPTVQGKLLGQLHDRIPMVTPEEQRTLQLENAEADERFWDGLHDMHRESAEGHKQLAANAERKVTENEAAIANATAKKAEAKKRIEGLKKGEDVAGGLSRLSYKECLKLLGWNASDVHNAELLNAMHKAGLWEAFMEELHRRREASEKAMTRAAARAVLLKQEHLATSRRRDW